MVMNTNILRFEILAFTLVQEANLVLPKITISDPLPFYSFPQHKHLPLEVVLCIK